MEGPVKSDTDKDKEIEEETTSSPVEADRSMTTEVETHRTMPSFLRWLSWILAVVIIAVLLVFFARWLYHVSHHTANPAPATSQKAPASSSQNKTSGAQPAAGTNNNSNGGSSAPNSSNSQIANTGPGNVVAVFAVSTIAAAGLHFIVSLRRQARS